jgi:hypothetical protein
MKSTHHRALLRVAVASVLLLGLAGAFGTDLVAGLLPAVQAEMSLLGREYALLSLKVTSDVADPTVRLRANLAHPLGVNGSTLYPLGWLGHPTGWYQVDLNARGVLQASLLLLIVVLGWPYGTWRELVARLLYSVPLLLVLLAVDAPLELLGNLEEAVVGPVDPDGFRLLFAWDRFLEGGGSCVLALAFATLAIGGARRAAAPSARPVLPSL